MGKAGQGVVFSLLLATCGAALSQEIIVRESETAARTKLLTVPFAFYNDTIGLSVGATIGRGGFPQPQSVIWGTGTVADSGTRYVFLALSDLSVPWVERLFIDGWVTSGEFSEIDVYTDGNPAFSDETAGSNDSDQDNFLQGEGDDVSVRFKVEFLLPLGSAREQVRRKVVLRDGLVVAGGREADEWSPRRSGFTFLSVSPFYRSQEIESEMFEQTDQVTGGVEIAIRYDNTDFMTHPSRGSRQNLQVTRDWGGFGSSNTWTTVEFEWSKYLSLGPTSRARQQVLALNAWTIETPTWNSFDLVNGTEVFHRPPSYAGASLGGLRRLRGYPEGRFHGRSAMYYAAEYRYIPKANPLKDNWLLGKLNAHVDWIQLVGFLEAGRVDDEYDIKELHERMKVSGGFGVRVFANNLIVRVEMAFSEEDFVLLMGINYPF